MRVNLAFRIRPVLFIDQGNLGGACCACKQQAPPTYVYTERSVAAVAVILLILNVKDWQRGILAGAAFL